MRKAPKSILASSRLRSINKNHSVISLNRTKDESDEDGLIKSPRDAEAQTSAAEKEQPADNCKPDLSPSTCFVSVGAPAAAGARDSSSVAATVLTNFLCFEQLPKDVRELVLLVDYDGVTKPPLLLVSKQYTPGYSLSPGAYKRLKEIRFQRIYKHIDAKRREVDVIIEKLNAGLAYYDNSDVEEARRCVLVDIEGAWECAASCGDLDRMIEVNGFCTAYNGRPPKIDVFLRAIQGRRALALDYLIRTFPDIRTRLSESAHNRRTFTHCAAYHYHPAVWSIVVDELKCPIDQRGIDLLMGTGQIELGRKLCQQHNTAPSYISAQIALQRGNVVTLQALDTKPLVKFEDSVLRTYDAELRGKDDEDGDVLEDDKDNEFFRLFSGRADYYRYVPSFGCNQEGWTRAFAIAIEFGHVNALCFAASILVFPLAYVIHKTRSDDDADATTINSAFYVAVIRGLASVVKWGINHGFFDAPGTLGKAICYALMAGNHSICDLLMSTKADTGFMYRSKAGELKAFSGKITKDLLKFRGQRLLEVSDSIIPLDYYYWHSMEIPCSKKVKRCYPIKRPTLQAIEDFLIKYGIRLHPESFKHAMLTRDMEAVKLIHKRLIDVNNIIAIGNTRDPGDVYHSGRMRSLEHKRQLKKAFLYVVTQNTETTFVREMVQYLVSNNLF